MNPTSIEQAAATVGESVERLRHWQRLGLLAGDETALPEDAVERARLISFAVRRGVSAEAIAARTEHEDVIGRFLELTGRADTPTHALSDAAQIVGLDEDTVRRLRIASGRGDQAEADEEDLEMLRGLALALQSGMPLEALLQLARVLNDALTRVAEAETRLFHFYVHERLRADGLSGPELDAATDAVSEPLRDLVEPAVLYFHRKAWQQALLEDLVLHLADDLHNDGDTVGQLPVTVLFVDLAGFTPMTEAMGDTAAAVVLERFSDLVRESASECDGRVLKQIGDEFMLIFPSATQAVRCGQSIMAKAADEANFPDVRLGAHTGGALYREGDYLGTTVNIAARVASLATRGQFLITKAVVKEIDPAVDTVPAGTHALKGVSQPVELAQVTTPRQHRPTDPVCGMIIDPVGCDITHDWQGQTLFFCSTACRDKFLQNPDRYVTP